MTETHARARRSAAYEHTKSGFETLSLDEKAVFLADALFTTVATGIDTVARHVSEELDGLAQSMRSRAHNASANPAEASHGAVDPMTAHDATRTPGAAEGAADPFGDEDLDGPASGSPASGPIPPAI